MKFVPILIILTLLSGCALMDDYYVTDYYGDDFLSPEEIVYEAPSPGCAPAASGGVNPPASPPPQPIQPAFHQTQEPPLNQP